MLTQVSLFLQPPKQDKKKDAGKSKKDKDPVNKSGGKAKKKACIDWHSSRVRCWLTDDCNIANCTFFDPEQKWSKGKVRDKLNNLVLFDKATYDKLYKEVPNYKLITPAVVSERLKIRGSLARNALQELLGKGELSQKSEKNWHFSEVWDLSIENFESANVE